MFYKSKKHKARNKFELSELATLCIPIQQFLDDYMPQSLDEQYSAFIAGARLSVLCKELTHALLHTGFEIHDDMKGVTGNEIVDELRDLKGEKLVDYLRDLLLSAGVKFTMEYNDEAKQLQKMARKNVNDDYILVGEIQDDWKNSSIKMKKLKPVHADHPHDEKHESDKKHKSDSKHHHFFSDRNRRIAEARARPSKKSNTFPQHGLSI